MAEPVVMIAAEMKCIADPVEQWHFGVRVMASDEQDCRMYQDQNVQKCCESESIIRGEKDNHPENGGKDLE